MSRLPFLRVDIFLFPLTCVPEIFDSYQGSLSYHVTPKAALKLYMAVFFICVLSYVWDRSLKTIILRSKLPVDISLRLLSIISRLHKLYSVEWLWIIFWEGYRRKLSQPVLRHNHSILRRAWVKPRIPSVKIVGTSRLWSSRTNISIETFGTLIPLEQNSRAMLLH
jgi:hypothetical protein